VSLLSPWALWFALSLPVVVGFYLLRRRRISRVVPSTVLWQRFLAENEANAPFQRLRRHALLILQLAILALVVIALARPFRTGNRLQGSLQVLILDASASMQAVDESPNRFEAARRQALAMVDALGPASEGQEMIALVAGAQAEVRQSATTDKALLRRAIESARVTDTPTRLEEALRVAATLVKDRPGAEVHLFSDGAVVDLAGIDTLDLPLVFHGVGRRNRNLGLVSAEMKSNPEDPTQRALFVRVANPTPEAAEVPLTVRFDDEVVASRQVRVGPTNGVAEVFVVDQVRDGVFTINLDQADDLAVDNTVSVVSRLPRPVRILLVTRGNRFLERALRSAAPRVEVTVAASVRAEGVEADIVVLDDVVPGNWPRANVLAIHAVRPEWSPGRVGSLEAPVIVDWKSTHPLLRFVGFDAVQVAQSLEMPTPSWAVSLVESSRSSLVWAGEVDGQRTIWIGFDLLQSTWPLRVGFPIFIANAIEWLDPDRIRAAAETGRTAAPVQWLWKGPGSVPTALVTVPDGGIESLVPSEGTREFVFPDTTQGGVYRVEQGTNRWSFAVNLLDARETDLTPKESLDRGRRAPVAATRIQPASLEGWRWFALAGFGILLTEWWWFHRRTA